MKKQFSLQSAVIAGIIATASMTIFTYMAPSMGFEMNIPKMLANTMGVSIILGWILHFMIGEVLAINFAAVFLNATSKRSDIKSGAVFGLIPWLIAQIMIMPMMSIMNGGSYTDGFFSGSIMISMASLVGHLIYGGVLGGFYKFQIEKTTVTA